MTFLVVGEALVDVVHDGDADADVRPGGSPMNVAVGLGRLGVNVTLLTDVGDDPWGTMICEHLTESGVKVVGQRSGATSSATATVGADGSAVYDFDLRWDPPVDCVDAASAAGIHVGSVGAFVAPGATLVRDLFGSVQGLRTYDPNIRPDLMPDHQQAVAIFDSIAALAHVVKMSDEDAAWLFPGLEPGAVADLLVRRGVPVVAITLGGRGSLLRSGSAAVSVAPRSVAVVDTIGAGDTFMASLIASFAQRIADVREVGSLGEADLVAIGDRAARAAAVTVSRRGANLPWAHEVERAVPGGAGGADAEQ